MRVVTSIFTQRKHPVRSPQLQGLPVRSLPSIAINSRHVLLTSPSHSRPQPIWVWPQAVWPAPSPPHTTLQIKCPDRHPSSPTSTPTISRLCLHPATCQLQSSPPSPRLPCCHDKVSLAVMAVTEMINEPHGKPSPNPNHPNVTRLAGARRPLPNSVPVAPSQTTV